MGNEHNQEASIDGSETPQQMEHPLTTMPPTNPSSAVSETESRCSMSDTSSVSHFATNNKDNYQLKQRKQTNRHSNKFATMEGIGISPRIIKIAVHFWHSNIDNLNVEKQLEIGCAFFFGMLSANHEMKKVMKSNSNKIERMSLKYLDMIGWLIRYLGHDINSAHSVLTSLGEMHRQFGIKIQHFDIMLRSLHETLLYYFPKNYDIQVKYSMDVIFAIAAQIMTQQKLKKTFYLNDVENSLNSVNNMDFLQSLEKCLTSSMGRDYFYTYLQSCSCDEIVMYLKLMNKFHIQTSDKERFMIARDIIRLCIINDATFSINISYESRVSTLNRMQKLEETFQLKQKFCVNSDLFEFVEMEMRRLIIKNHWLKFVDNVEKL